MVLIVAALPMKVENMPSAQIKRYESYLECLAARQEGDWGKVEKVLSRISEEKIFILQDQNLITASLELEKAYLAKHQGNTSLAKHHFMRAKKLVIRKYGPLHPHVLPFYEKTTDFIGSIEEGIAAQKLIHSLQQSYP